MRSFLPFLLAGVLLAAAVPALAEGGGERGRRSGDSGSHEDGFGRMAVGGFSVEASTRNVTGQYMSFGYDAAGIRAFTLHGVKVFDAAVQATGESGRPAQATAEGAEIRVSEPGFTFIGHDNPVAVSRLRSEGPVVLTFTSGVALTRIGEGRAAFTIGNLTGAIRADHLVISGQTIRAADDILVLLDAPAGSFDPNRADINEAIGNKHIGAEASFNKNGLDIKQDVVSYGNVTMTTTRAEQGNLSLLIEGHGTEGRVLVLNVDNAVLGAEHADQLHVQLDNASIAPADSLADILDPDNDGYLPEYYVVFDPGTNAFQLLVSVPHYSVHTLSLTTAIILPPPSVLAGIGLGVLLLVPTAFVLFRRPK